jgi:hypothetical protein
MMTKLSSSGTSVLTRAARRNIQEDNTLRHIIVGHFVRNDTGHVMQYIDVTRDSRLTQELVPPTTVLSFICCSQAACNKKFAPGFHTTYVAAESYPYTRTVLP